MTVSAPAGALAFGVFPNPNAGSFTIQLPDHEAAFEAALFAADGRLVWRQSLAGSAAEVTPEPGLLPGLYWLWVQTGSGYGARKLVVAR